MVKVKLSNGVEIFLSDRFKLNLDIRLNTLKNKKLDLVIINDGSEGSGKTLKNKQIGYYCADVLGVPFTPDNIHYDSDEYLKASKGNGLWHINILDEGDDLYTRLANTTKLINFTRYLRKCREGKHQVHILTMPLARDFDSYILFHRMSMILHSKLELQLKLHGDPKKADDYHLIQDNAVCYPKSKRLKEYLALAKRNNWFGYPSNLQGFDCVFKGIEVFTAEQNAMLVQKKQEYVNSVDEEQDEKANGKSKAEEALDRGLLYDHEVERLTHKQIGDKYGLSEKTVWSKLKRVKSRNSVMTGNYTIGGKISPDESIQD